MKSSILQLLSSGEIISGETLSQDLEVSRVTIWKHIKQLKESGYRIHSSGKGYQLRSEPDAPFSWTFPGRESRIHYFQEVPSTMEIAKDLARNGCPAFTVVIAEKQINGRGRLQRKWFSKSGGLYFTLVLRPQIPPSLMSNISFAASLCLSRAIEAETGVLARAKWPNDLLFEDRKLSGMLCEMDVTDERVEFLNIGIGLNVNNSPEKDEPIGISLKSISGKSVDRRNLLARFLDEMENELLKPSLGHIIKAWKARTITLNRQVRVVTTNEIIEGKAVDVDETGALIVALADQTTKKIYFGDCFLKPES